MIILLITGANSFYHLMNFGTYNKRCLAKLGGILPLLVTIEKQYHLANAQISIRKPSFQT